MATTLGRVVDYEIHEVINGKRIVIREHFDSAEDV